MRPEHFEDATIEGEGDGRMKFRAKVDVVESMGSELYAYFDVDTKGEVQSDELADLAKDAGLEDLPSGGAQHVVARLDAASKAAPGGEIEMTLDTTQIKLFDPDGGRSLTHTGTGHRQRWRSPRCGRRRRERLVAHLYTGNAFQAA